MVAERPVQAPPVQEARCHVWGQVDRGGEVCQSFVELIFLGPGRAAIGEHHWIQVELKAFREIGDRSIKLAGLQADKAPFAPVTCDLRLGCDGRIQVGEAFFELALLVVVPGPQDAGIDVAEPNGFGVVRHGLRNLVLAVPDFTALLVGFGQFRGELYRLIAVSQSLFPTSPETECPATHQVG